MIARFFVPQSLQTSRALALVLCLVVEIGAPAFFAAETPPQIGAVSADGTTAADVAQDANEVSGGGSATSVTGPSDPNAAAPSPSQASPPAPHRKEPRKEESGPRRRRFLRTPAGLMLMIVVGALVVGGATQAVLDAGSSR